MLFTSPTARGLPATGGGRHDRLARRDWPVILEDFAEDPPGGGMRRIDDYHRCSVAAGNRVSGHALCWAAAFGAEVAALFRHGRQPQGVWADDCRIEFSGSHGRAPTACQINAWFWRHTITGRLLIALPTAAMASENNASENNASKTVGSRFFVLAYWLP